MIELKNAVKKYILYENETVALDNMNLSVREGEMTAVVGTSGSGKSTLLNILGGMDRLTSGSYLFDGQEVSGLSYGEMHRFRKQNISFVFQNFALIERCTVYENLEIPLLARNEKHCRKRIMDCLERLKIADLAQKYPRHLSGGQQQRCAIGRALVTDSRLLLCDEPTGALDSRTSAEIMDLLCEANAGGRTVLIVTHDVDVAARCSRRIRIEDGKIVE